MNLENIIDIIHSHTGIDASTLGEYSFVSAIEKGMKQHSFNNSEDYIKLIENSSTELTNFIEEIIVPETWFFREDKAFDVMIAELNKHRQNDLSTPGRILSLPCSTGEEPYTIAMKLFESGFTAEMFSIDAIDISQINIAKACLGKYGANSFRAKISEKTLSEYFTVVDEGYQVKEQVKQVISFISGNIFSSDILTIMQYYDVIFCRNLFIYFSKETKKVAFQKLHESLKNNGLFLIGHAETSVIPMEQYQPANVQGSFGYIKSVHKKVNETSSGKFFTRKKSPPHKTERLNRKLTTRTNPESDQKQDEVLLANEKFIEKYAKNNLKLASKLADQGKLDEALELAVACIQLDKTVNCYTLLGNIYGAMGNLDDAEKSYRKALYLDANNYEALIHLAFIFDKKGDTKNSQLFRKRAEKQQSKIM